ncbi:MAG: class I SAM-dependent rRNA methyltransferase [Proteobacteria bacterium]|nr:class I SAM-dependent rRNA methyltransferase [Pseudomonadota bacterium]
MVAKRRFFWYLTSAQGYPDPISEAMMSTPAIYIKQGREKPLRQRHPWVFSGAIQRSDAAPPGAIVDILDYKGSFLARGYANPASKLTARALTWDPTETIDSAFWQRRVDAAIARRRPLLSADQTACRLIMSEADQLPGLIVDKYGEHLVIQALTAGIDRHIAPIVTALHNTLSPLTISERSDDSVRDLEGLPRINRLLHGSEAALNDVLIVEQGVNFRIDIGAGHKTGFYLDQRRNHTLIGSLASGRKVLDCFSYTGGFTMHAAKGGAASILSVDASEPALARLRENLSANGFAADDARFQQRAGNAFEVLRDLVQSGERFDLITLDPPKFAASGGQVEKAARGYKDLNMLALKLLNPGGMLATFSCSGHISLDLYQKIVFGAAIDADRNAQITSYLFQADDHPVLLTFPESLYLKGLLCRVL